MDRKLAKKGAKMAKNSREKKIFSQNLGQGKYVFKVKIGAKMAKNAQKFGGKKKLANIGSNFFLQYKFVT